MTAASASHRLLNFVQSALLLGLMTTALVTREGDRQIAARSQPLQSLAFEAKKRPYATLVRFGRRILPRRHFTISWWASYLNRRKGTLLRIGSALVGITALILRSSSPPNTLP